MTSARNFFVVLVVMTLSVALGRSAIAAPELKGSYAVQGSGTAMLANPSPSGCVGALVSASYHGTWVFDGKGKITTASTINLDIAGTFCTFSNYSVSGTYKVDDTGPSTFSAEGTLTTTPQGPRAPCKDTFLIGLNFSIDGDKSGHTINITTGSSGGSYAKGTPAGGNTCTAAVQDFSTNGTGTLVH